MNSVSLIAGKGQIPKHFVKEMDILKKDLLLSVVTRGKKNMDVDTDFCVGVS